MKTDKGIEWEITHIKKPLRVGTRRKLHGKWVNEWWGGNKWKLKSGQKFGHSFVLNKSMINSWKNILKNGNIRRRLA